MNISDLNAILAPQGLTTVPIKTQETSQQFEWNYCRRELADEAAVNSYLNRVADQNTLETAIFKEFLGRNQLLYRDILHHIRERTVLEIGSSWCPEIAALNARERICIEPMAERIENFVRDNYGLSIFGKLTTYAIYADQLAPDLVGQIDGLIYCRNCIDHSPRWPFILSNIASYARSGCKLLIWNDIHRPTSMIDGGHYNICEDHGDFIRLIENLGFSIHRIFTFHDRGIVNIGLVATKIAATGHSDKPRYEISERGERDVRLASL